MIPWIQSGGFSGYGTTFADINGDGKVDALAYYAGLGGWNTFVGLSNGDGTFGPMVPWIQSINGLSGYSTAFADVNGDGKADGITYYVSTGGMNVFTASTPVQAFEQIGSVATGLAATTQITYAPLTNSVVYTKDSGAVFPLADVQSPMFVVSRVDNSNGVGGNYSTTYSYVGARADLAGRGFLGVRQMKVLDLQTNILQTTNYRLDFPFLMQVASTTRTLGSLTLNSTTNTYNSATLAGPRYRVTHTQAQVTGADLDGTALPSTTSTFQYDAYGNATKVVVTSSDGSVKTTTNSYDNGTTTHWLIGRLTSSSVKSQIP
jgi:hypothetical protein